MAEEPDRERTPAEKERTTALAKVEMGQKGVMISAMDSLKEFAETAVKAGVAPKGMGVGAAMMAIQAGLERGMAPLGGLQAAVVINGVLSWRGWAAMAMMRQSGLVVPGTLKSWVDGDLDGPKANAVGYATAKRIGYAEPFVREFSVSDAKKAGLWNKGGPWQTRPGNMLEWRALGDLVRFSFPEVMGGIPIAEDVEAGGIGPAVTVEGPQERAHRPAPKISDPLLAEVVDEGDKSGIPAEVQPTSSPEGGADPKAPPTPPEHHEPEPTTGPTVADVFPKPEVKMEGDKRGWQGGPGDLPPEEHAQAQERLKEPASPKGPAPAVEPSEGNKRALARGVATAGELAEEGLAAVDAKKKGKATPCPRCGEEDSGFALFGECGICNYPEPEPGAEA